MIPCITCLLRDKLKGFKRRFPRAAFIPFQGFRILRPFILPVARIFHKTVAEHYQNHLNQSFKKFAQMSLQARQQIMSDLETFSLPSSVNIKISLIGASRRKNNPNNRMDKFFKSLLQQTADISTVEVLVRIDNDDDLLFFHDMWSTYGSRVRIRFVMNETVRGYENLFKLVSELLDYLSDSSEIVFGFADDCLITRPNWDLDFIKISLRYQDNIFFINTLRDFTISYANKEMFFWLLWQHGPPSLFSAVGRRVLEITKSVALKYPGWTAYGNTVMCDSFFEALQLYIWELTGKKRAPVVVNTIIAQTDIAISPHKEGGLFSASPVAIRSNKKFLENETQVVIAEMAAQIAKVITESGAPVIPGIIFPVLPDTDNVKISFVGEFTKFFNNLEEMKLLFNSIVKNTSDPSRIEFLFCFNENDNAENLENIKTLVNYSHQISVSYFIQSESEMMLMNAGLLNALAPSSKLIIGIEHAFEINHAGWDDALLHIARKYPDDIFMLNVASEPVLNFEDKHKYFWELWHNGYSICTPAISRRMLEFIAQKMPDYLDEKVNNQLFFKALGFYIWSISGCKRVENLTGNIVPAASFKPATISYEEYKDFLNSNHQLFINSIALMIVDKFNLTQSVSGKQQHLTV